MKIGIEKIVWVLDIFKIFFYLLNILLKWCIFLMILLINIVFFFIILLKGKFKYECLVNGG